MGLERKEGGRWWKTRRLAWEVDLQDQELRPNQRTLAPRCWQFALVPDMGGTQTSFLSRDKSCLVVDAVSCTNGLPSQIQVPNGARIEQGAKMPPLSPLPSHQTQARLFANYKRRRTPLGLEFMSRHTSANRLYFLLRSPFLLKALFSPIPCLSVLHRQPPSLDKIRLPLQNSLQPRALGLNLLEI